MGRKRRCGPQANVDLTGCSTHEHHGTVNHHHHFIHHVSLHSCLSINSTAPASVFKCFTVKLQKRPNCLFDHRGGVTTVQ